MLTPKHFVSRVHMISMALVALFALALLLLILHASKVYASGKISALVAPAGALAASDTYSLSLPLVMTGCKPLGPEYPVCVLTTGRAALYSGPGSEYYTWLGNLPPKQSVAPLAQYGDYTKVAAVVGGGVQVGFVPTFALSPLPTGLPVLGAADVPVKEVDFVKYLLLSPIASSMDDSVVLDNRAASGWNDVSPLVVDFMSPFTLTFQIDMDNDENHSMIKLADSPTPNDWWKDIRRMDIYTDRGLMGFTLYDGLSPSPVANRSWGVYDQQVITVSSPDSTGKVFKVLDQNGRQIDKIDVTDLESPRLAQGLFPEGQALFGRVVAPGSLLTIRSLSLRLQPSGVVESLPAVEREPTLRRLGNEQGIPIGAGFEWWVMAAANPDYSRIIEKVYSTLVLSNFSLPSFWPARGEYDYREADAIVNWAVRSGYRVRASHLVWGAWETIPSWLVNGNFTRDEYIQILEEHVKTVVGHFKGRIKEWSVANEAVNRSNRAEDDFWNAKIGPDYIPMAFRWAREADPDAVLIFNEVNNEDPRDDGTQWVVETMLEKVKELKEQGVPIDVVGMQMHLFLPGQSQIPPTPPTKEGVMETMKRFGALGVRIYITEMDVNLEAVEGTQEEKWQFEADLYRDMTEACIESGVCDSFTTWGVGDKDSWLTCTGGFFCLPNADPLMFDKDYQPKSAFFAVYNAFAQGVEPGERR